MKKYSLSTAWILIGFALLIMQACQKEDPNDPGDLTQNFYGPVVSLGDGTASTWFLQDENGDPSAVGVVLSDEALDNLPDEPVNFVLELPAGSGFNFYTHVLLDWNPQGHEPPGIYDLPHFDLHFYIISNEHRMMMGPMDSVEFANAPQPDYIPAGYFNPGGGVPMMGAHWLDATAPELNGETFTSTFIWGSYDGEFVFWEPMLTRDYLLSQPDDETPLKMPAAFQREGWYPTKFRVSHSAMDGAYTVALTGLTHYNATPAK